MGALTRIWSKLAGSVTRAGEGEYRPGPYFLPVTGGWLTQNAGQNLNWWQLGYNVLPSGARSAIVEACVSAYSQTVAMCPGDHWKLNDKKGRDRVTTSALCRILRQPNDYQSISDFLMNAVRSLYLDGNAYALCLRNDRFEIDELHLMHPRYCRALVAVTGEIFYELGGNIIIDRRMGPLGYVPARDVLHIKLHTPRDPLLGESPLWSAMLDLAANDAMAAQTVSFFNNQARPSFVLSTDLLLDKEQVQSLRDRWNEQTRGDGVGGTPILTGGLKPQPIGISGRDSQIAELIKASETHIALAFRVPLQILGLGGTPLGSTEALMQMWIASGLGFCLNHVEEAFGITFGLKGQPDEYVEFNTAALLRSAFKDRIEGLVRAVQGGVLAPNEARETEGYSEVPYGDEPRVQQQVVPLSAAGKIPASPSAPPSPAPPSADEGPSPRSPPDATKQLSARKFFERSAAIGRRRSAVR
jgi:HK97 family phage portal protein